MVEFGCVGLAGPDEAGGVEVVGGDLIEGALQEISGCSLLSTISTWEL